MAARLLSEAHVVVVPGEAFGTAEHIRLSYAVRADVIDEGVSAYARVVWRPGVELAGAKLHGLRKSASNYRYVE